MRKNLVGSGIFALVALGAFVLFRNRNSIRGVLERQGIRVPHRDEIMDRIRVGANRMVNRVEEQVEEVKDQPRETLKEVG